MSNQIQVRWNSGMSRADFQASREALQAFPNKDAITISVGIKGELSEGDLDQILVIASRSDAEVKVTLTGTFEAGKQLRLFGPSLEQPDQLAMGVDGGMVTSGYRKVEGETEDKDWDNLLSGPGPAEENGAGV